MTDTVGAMLAMDRDKMANAALSEPLGAGGVVVVPYFDGERTPNRPYAHGGIVGLSTSASASKVARASYEGVVCSILDARDHLPVHGGSLFLVGGGSRSRAYQQIVAPLPLVAEGIDNRPVHGALICFRPVLDFAFIELQLLNAKAGHTSHWCRRPSRRGIFDC